MLAALLRLHASAPHEGLRWGRLVAARGVTHLNCNRTPHSVLMAWEAHVTLEGKAAVPFQLAESCSKSGSARAGPHTMCPSVTPHRQRTPTQVKRVTSRFIHECECDVQCSPVAQGTRGGVHVVLPGGHMKVPWRRAWRHAGDPSGPGMCTNIPGHDPHAVFHHR